MDVLHLNEQLPCLLTYLQNAGYSSMYIDYVSKFGKWLSDNFKQYQWEDYADVECTLADLWSNKYTLRNKVRLLRVIRQYAEEGIFPDGHKHYHKPYHYDLLNKEYRKVVDIVSASIDQQKRFFRSVRSALCSFFFDLQRYGMATLASITEDAILHVFSPEEMPMKGHSFKYNVEYGLKACVPYYGEAVGRIISYLPSIPNKRKNIQYLTKQELNAIKHTLEYDDTVSLQDKAIITIAMYTGLRGCDISGLTFDSFDWQHDLIKITQSKTGNQLILPLRAVVGNAIFDYLQKERPICPDPYIFLTVNAPYRRLHTSNLDAICSKLMYKAGIRLQSKERKSIHLFRHHVATALLQSGVQQPVISAALGHSSPESLDHYLSAEFKRLKECSLSIKGFPMRKEAFDK